MTEPRSTDAPPKRPSILAICKPTASLAEALASFAPAGNWRTDCVYMRPKEKALGDLFLLRFSEQPGAQFLVSRGQVLEAGREIVPVLEGWRTHAQKNKVSAEGTTYQAFDFVVRHGTLFLNAPKSGTVVEVEALSSAAVEAGAERALRNFLDELLPPEQREFTSSFAVDGFDLPATFSRRHAACQFVSLCRASVLPEESRR